MKFVKSIGLLLLGICIGVKVTNFFYPGTQSGETKTPQVIEAEIVESATEEEKVVSRVSSSLETLSVDTEYVLEETDLVSGSVVETTWRLPDKYIGLNREQFLEAMEHYEMFPPLSEIERGFVSLEVLSFSREKVVVQMNYQYIQPGDSYYLAVRNHEVVVYLEDMETVYINTGILLENLPQEIQMEIMQTIWVEEEEKLYDFLEAYSS